MGSARWDPGKWGTMKASLSSTSFDDKFTTRSHAAVDKTFVPKHIEARESRDSDPNPKSTPIILALDCTGSMNPVINEACDRMGDLMLEIIKREPITDPHILAMMVGDVECDRMPLQVTQFEADERVIEQFKKLYVEGGGGGNRYESYHLPWYFAALKCQTDSWAKRKKKGYLFVVGDELPPPTLTKEQLQSVFGRDEPGETLTGEQILRMAEKQWEVFQIVVEQGSNYRALGHDASMKPWVNLLGQRAIRLSDIKALPEVVVSAIQVNEGADADAVANSWSGSTAVAVRNAVKDLAPSKGGTTESVVNL